MYFEYTLKRFVELTLLTSGLLRALVFSRPNSSGHGKHHAGLPSAVGAGVRLWGMEGHCGAGSALRIPGRRRRGSQAWSPLWTPSAPWSPTGRHSSKHPGFSHPALLSRPGTPAAPGPARGGVVGPASVSLWHGTQRGPFQVLGSRPGRGLCG